jgi:hypothetical protein
MSWLLRDVKASADHSIGVELYQAGKPVAELYHMNSP